MYTRPLTVDDVPAPINTCLLLGVVDAGSAHSAQGGAESVVTGRVLTKAERERCNDARLRTKAFLLALCASPRRRTF